MVKNMKQVNKMLEHVNKDMNSAELVKVMDKFEQVSIFFFFYARLSIEKFYFQNLGI